LLKKVKDPTTQPAASRKERRATKENISEKVRERACRNKGGLTIEKKGEATLEKRL